MPTFNNDPVVSNTNNANQVGVSGESASFNGVRGVTHAAYHGAVVGISENHTQQAGPGVFGQSDGTGVWGQSKTWMGVYGKTESTTGGAGVMGEGDPGPGVIGKSTKWIGVYGETAGIANGPAGVWGEHKGAGTGIKAVSKDGTGLAAYSTTAEAVHAETHSPNMAAIAAYNLAPNANGVAVYADSSAGEAVHAETHSPGTAAIAAYNLAPNATGAAVFAKKAGSIGHAGFFDGDVYVTRSVTVEGDVVLHNADCAEEFTVSDPELAQPGTVMVIGEGGTAVLCASPYDHRVIGVVSGAGGFRPALLLDRQDVPGRRPIALMGKVMCRVDANHGAIRPGDLLTTSSTPGHAMKATDAARAPGATIGKALAQLDAGQGTIPILAILQ